MNLRILARTGIFGILHLLLSKGLLCFSLDWICGLRDHWIQYSVLNIQRLDAFV
jgi:hypothetical protein